MKNPEAETSFLPDRDREQKEEALRRQIEMEYELREQVSSSLDPDLIFAANPTGTLEVILLLCNV